jgi:hypothetical protein
MYKYVECVESIDMGEEEYPASRGRAAEVLTSLDGETWLVRPAAKLAPLLLMPCF